MLKKFSIILSLVIIRISGVCAQNIDSVFRGDLQLEQSRILASEMLANEQTQKLIYLILFSLSVLICIFVVYISRFKSKEYGKVINLQNQELIKHNFKEKSYGYMLNLTNVPMCLINQNKEIVWNNIVFNKVYGEIKNFDIYKGVDLQSIKDKSLEIGTEPTIFSVELEDKTKFNRTICKINDQNSDYLYVVIDNHIFNN